MGRSARAARTRPCPAREKVAARPRGRDPRQLGPGRSWRPGLQRPPDASGLERSRVEVNPRGPEQGKPQKTQAAPGAQRVAATGQTARFLFLWGDGALISRLFFYPPSKVASLPPCLQNTGFPFHDKKLRVFAGGARYPSNHSKHNWESPSFRLRPALPLSRAVKNYYGPAQLGPHTQKPLPARLLRKLNHMGPVLKGGFSCGHLELLFSLCLRGIRSGGMWGSSIPVPSAACQMCSVWVTSWMAK